MKALVTFGCSWTAGIGCWYDEDTSLEEYKKARKKFKLSKIMMDNSYRFILANRHGYDNINFSAGGSSNGKQFRLAEEYFNLDDYKKYDEVIVLWGITSTARLDAWDVKNNRYTNVFLNNKSLPKTIEYEWMMHHYDHDVEVRRLSNQMQHWDKYFSMIGVKNYWFDTFNHHDYEYNSPNMIMGDENPRDLMSKLCKDQGLLFNEDRYHFSSWSLDNARIKFLLKRRLVNPHSCHPNKQCHILLADILDKNVKFCYNK